MGQAFSVEVVGAGPCAATMHTAAKRLDDLAAANAAASAIIAAAAVPRAPRLTGRLRDSIRAEPREGSANVVAAAPYAPYVHWGVPSRNVPARPFLVQARDATEPQWSAVYAADVDGKIRQVKGA